MLEGTSHQQLGYYDDVDKVIQFCYHWNSLKSRHGNNNSVSWWSNVGDEKRSKTENRCAA